MNITQLLATKQLLEDAKKIPVPPSVRETIDVLLMQVDTELRPVLFLKRIEKIVQDLPETSSADEKESVLNIVLQMATDGQKQ